MVGDFFHQFGMEEGSYQIDVERDWASLKAHDPTVEAVDMAKLKPSAANYFPEEETAAGD